MQVLSKNNEVSPEKNLDETAVVHDLALKVPSIETMLESKDFISSDRFHCRNDGVIEYIEEELFSPLGKIKLLHEYGHKVLGHSGLVFDKELIENERLAWAFSIEAAKHLQIEVTETTQDEIRKMYKTYTNFKEQRGVCTSCGSNETEQYGSQTYSCKNCFTDF